MAVYLTIPTTPGNYASAPDIAAYAVTDVDVRVALTFDWDDAGTQYFFSTHDATGDGAGFAFGIEPDEQLRFYWAETGRTTGEYVSSNANMRSAADSGDLLAIRLTVDADNGSGAADVSFYYRTTTVSTAYAACLANTGWTQLGTTTDGGYGMVFTINDSPASLKVGALNAAGGNADGNYYAAVFLDGIAGTPVFAEDFTTETAGETSITESSANAAVVTINQTGSPQAELATDAALLVNTILDYALADLTISDSPGY